MKWQRSSSLESIQVHDEVHSHRFLYSLKQATDLKKIFPPFKNFIFVDFIELLFDVISQPSLKCCKYSAYSALDAYRILGRTRKK